MATTTPTIITQHGVPLRDQAPKVVNASRSWLFVAKNRGEIRVVEIAGRFFLPSDEVLRLQAEEERSLKLKLKALRARQKALRTAMTRSQQLKKESEA
jgi:hypothetical protein